MLHKVWNSKGEMLYCFPRSSIKFQGHTVQNITDFDPNWACPDFRPVAAFKSLRFALFTSTPSSYLPIRREIYIYACRAQIKIWHSSAYCYMWITYPHFINRMFSISIPYQVCRCMVTTFCRVTKFIIAIDYKIVNVMLYNHMFNTSPFTSHIMLLFHNRSKSYLKKFAWHHSCTSTSFICRFCRRWHHCIDTKKPYSFSQYHVIL